VIFGALALFQAQDERLARASARVRYYPLLRRDQLGHASPPRSGYCRCGRRRRRSVSRQHDRPPLRILLVTIGVAAVIALIVGNRQRSVNGASTAGPRAATGTPRACALPMRATLFCVIALVVVLTSLSELGGTSGRCWRARASSASRSASAREALRDFITAFSC
jgi:hypothetical protein